MSTVLSVEKLSKRYGSVQALQEVSFEVPKGSVYGLLGPNGSGKTTALGIVSGVLNPASGTYHWFGQPASAANVRQRIGTLLETPNFYPYLSAYRNLTIPAKIKGVPEADIDRVLRLTGLEQRKHSAFRGFSLGMKQRLALASTLLGDPEVLVLDEPTNGLDPQGIVEVRELIGRIAEAGKTILIASHLLDEVEKVCTHVAVLQRGQLKAVGPVHNILNSEDQVLMSADNLEQLERALNELYPHVKKRTVRNEIAMVMPQQVSPAQLNRAIMEKGVALSHLALQKKSLESQFMEIIGQPS